MIEFRSRIKQSHVFLMISIQIICLRIKFIAFAKNETRNADRLGLWEFFPFRISIGNSGVDFVFVEFFFCFFWCQCVIPNHLLSIRFLWNTKRIRWKNCDWFVANYHIMKRDLLWRHFFLNEQKENALFSTFEYICK